MRGSRSFQLKSNSADQMWQEIVTSKLGFQNLQEMHEAWPWKKERSGED